MKKLARIGVGVGVGTCALIAVIVIIVVATKSGDEEPEVDGPWDKIRLPENIAAEKYRMFLDINWEDMTYNGTQEVTMKVTGEAKYFLIHSAGLTIDKDKTTLHDVEADASLGVKRSFMDTEVKPELKHDFYVVESKTVVEEGQYKMKIYFSGTVQTERLTGMYRSGYVRQLTDKSGADAGNVTVYQISTDFEPVDARSAFPCFDEPAQKAKWETDISVTFPEAIDINDYNIISNMPLKTDNYVRTDKTLSGSFEESVPMSTYLVCFAVTDFLYVSGTYTRADSTTVDMKVYARREQKFQDSAAYAIKITPLILEKYEDFYKVNYPLPKLDQIALPEFNSGAMENWGIITYRESALLYNSVTSSNEEKQRVCAVIAHEIAHQWFGNIVTMAWWNDLWLNEGFASFVEYYGMDAAEPKWDILNFFYPDEVTTAMNFDSSPSSHPISVTVESPAELSGLFDTISYRKGSSINWMMQQFMGKEAFALGLEKYIAKHQWGNAEMIDLFDALNEGLGASSTINVTEIMLGWTMQMGFPYVNVTLVKDAGAGTTKITLRQGRFLQGEKEKDDTSEFGYKWHIPFTYVASDDPATESDVTWMLPDAADGETVITVNSQLDWVKGNANGNYYYITNYEDAVWDELSDALIDNSITSATDKTSLIYDVFRLAEIGQVAYDKALEMTKYATAEEEYVVLNRILVEVLSAGYSIQDDEAATSKFWNYTATMLKPRVDDVGWGPANDSVVEPITTPKMRDMAIRNYCKAVKNATDPTVVEALTKFTAFAADSETEKANIKDVFVSVMRTAIIYDDEDATNWQAMWELLQNSDWEADQRIYLSALSRTNDETLLRQMIADSFEEDAKLGSWRYLYYVHYHGDHYALGWELLQTNWDIYAEKYNATSFTMGYLVGMPDVFDTQEKYTEVEAFYKSKADSIGTGIKASLETLAKIKSNIEWRTKNAEIVKNWFATLP